MFLYFHGPSSLAAPLLKGELTELCPNFGEAVDCIGMITMHMSSNVCNVQFTVLLCVDCPSI